MLYTLTLGADIPLQKNVLNEKSASHRMKPWPALLCKSKIQIEGFCRSLAKNRRSEGSNNAASWNSDYVEVFGEMV